MNFSSVSSTADPPLGTIVELSSGIGTGVVRFSGYTDFKPGKWVGVELFEQNGKNDGSVGGLRYFTCKGGMGYGVFVRGSQIKRVVGNERDTQTERRPSSTAATTMLGTAAVGAARVPRPTLGHQRTSSLGNGLNTSSLRVSPASASASASGSSSRSASPAKPSSSSSMQTMTRLGLGGQVSPSKRSSSNLSNLALSSSTTTRLGQTTTTNPGQATMRPGHQARRSISLKQAPTPSSASHPPRVSSPLTKSPSPVPPSSAVPVSAPSSSVSASAADPVPSVLPSAVPAAVPAFPATLPDTHPQIHALLTKIRVLETNRSLDTFQIQSLEAKLAESSSFLSLRPKLQAKLQSQQSEITSLKQELNELRNQVKVWEERKDVVEGELEMCLLDKEMAEETLAEARGELEGVKERLGELEVEVEVLREEKELWELENDGEVSARNEGGKQKDSLAYIQLDKQNERLKEALLRLRDMTQETDQDQRRRIAEMEKDLTNYEEMQSQLSTTTVKLSNAETQIEDLKLQLDDALGAEDMLVQLTERNLVLGEKIEEMRITIEDLEALKELSDELEENHLETEKALQVDIENFKTQLASSQLKILTLSDTCADYEGTIGQFRDLVVQLQGELNALRLSSASFQSAHSEALSQTALILSANIRLQSNAAKSRAREVEVALGKMRERELKEELEIVEGFLPGVYREGVVVEEVGADNASTGAQRVVGAGSTEGHGHSHSQSQPEFAGTSAASGPVSGSTQVSGNDRDALRVYMFFQRIASKADIINSIVAQTHNLPGALDLGDPGEGDVTDHPGDGHDLGKEGVKKEGKVVTEQLVGVCEMRGRLSVLSTTCKRLSAILRRSSPELWISIGRLYGELKPLEKRMDIHVDLLRRDEFRERECVSDVIKINAQFSHLAEMYFGNYFNGQLSGYDIAERQLGTLTLFDLDLDMFAASIGMMKTSVEGLLKEEEFAADADFGGFDIESELYTPLLMLLSRSKAAKTSARRIAKRLEELASGSTSTSTASTNTSSSSGASAALKAQLLPQMEALSNTVQELVNFGISLAQQTLPYLDDVRSGKTSFKLTVILGFAKQQAGQINLQQGSTTTTTTGSSSSKTMSTINFKPGILWWEVVGDIIEHLIQDSARLLPFTMDPVNVFSNTVNSTPPPWIHRIQTVQALLSSSLSSAFTHKISSLKSDILSLSRSLKTKDQLLAELNVKIQLLERRAEGNKEEVKRMEGVVKEMEGEVGRLRKVEAGYEEAMEQMQGEVETLEREVGRLRGLGVSVGGVSVAASEQPKIGAEQEGASAIMSAGVMAEVNLDQAQLLDQYTALRNTVRFLRTENAYLRGHDLIKEMQALPVIPEPRLQRSATPALEPSGLSDTDTEEEGSEDTDTDEVDTSTSTNISANTKYQNQKSSLPLLTETKLLYRSVMRYSSSPRVVDLSEVNERRLEVSRRRGIGRSGNFDGEGAIENNDKTEKIDRPEASNIGVLEGQGTKLNANPKIHTEKSSDFPEIAPRPSGVWMPRKRMPAHQLLERRLRGEKLNERVRGLVERVERANVVRIGVVRV